MIDDIIKSLDVQYVNELCFCIDYIRIRTTDLIVSIYSDVTVVNTAGERVAPDHEQWRNMICGIVGIAIKQVRVEERSTGIAFQNGILIVIPYKRGEHENGPVYELFRANGDYLGEFYS